MWRRFVACVRCTSDDTNKQPRQKRSAKAKSKTPPHEHYDPDNPIPDVFDSVVVGDPFLVQLYNEDLITGYHTALPNTIIRMENGYRLYLDEYTITIDGSRPVLNICFMFTDCELQADSNVGFSREIRQLRRRQTDPYLRYDPHRPSTSSAAPRGQEQPASSMQNAGQSHRSIEQPSCSRGTGSRVARTGNPTQSTSSGRAVALTGPSRPVRLNPALPMVRHPLLGSIETIWISPPMPEYAHETQDAAETKKKGPRQNRMKLTKRRHVSSLHRIVRQQIGDPLYPNIEPGLSPRVIFTVDFFRLITYRLSEPGERERHMRQLNIPLTIPNILPISTVPFRGAIFNRFRSMFSRVRRRDYCPPERNNPEFDPFTLNLAEQRRYLEAQMITIMMSSEDQSDDDS